MSSLLLKEIGSSNPEDQSILELFASSREDVIHVSATHLLPDQIAVTTKNGFVELINTASGEFRLFLTYLDRIPLDASLRCFSLVPSLYAASMKHHHYLLFSLSYSNELLLGNVETGAVQMLATCESRPSVVKCDGDYIVCGEGNGQLSVWRGSAEGCNRVRLSGASNASLPPLLWQQKFFDNTVVCIGLHRGHLVCCCADYRCVVASVEDGRVQLSLSSLYLGLGVAAFALTQPPLIAGKKVLAVCFTSRISVFALQPSGDGETKKTAAAGSLPVLSSSPGSSERWSYRESCGLSEGEEITCASCLGAYMSAGTRSGLVLLYACDAAAQQVVELVRFNVGYGVKGTQLFADNTLLVVTSAGDVWRWPLADLLHTAKQNVDGSVRAAHSGENVVDDEEEEPAPAVDAPPQPSVAPGLKTAAHPMQLRTTLQEVGHPHKNEVEEHNLLRRGINSVLHGASCDEKAAVKAGNTTTPIEDTGAVPFSSDDCDAKGDGVTSTHMSPLGRGDDVNDIVVPAEDDGDVRGGPHNEDSLGTDGHPTEPTTALSLSSPPLARQSSDVTEKRGAVKSFSQEKPQALLRDPESAADGSGASTDADIMAVPLKQEAATVSVEVSHCDSIGGVSPLSSADTTAHIEANAAGAKERESSIVDPSSADMREDKQNTPTHAQVVTSGDSKGPTTSSLDWNGREMRGATLTSTSTLPKSLKGTNVRAPKETQEMAQLEVEFDRAVARLLGPRASIEGLRRGRRMDPRKVTGVLHNLASQHAATVAVGASLMDSEPSALSGLNSTKLLEEKRAAVAAAAFDFDVYRQAHRLEVDAVQYHHPVKALTYTLRDRVFSDVEAVTRICNSEDSGASALAARKVIPPPPSQDELRDVTYGRVKRVIDPMIVEERRRGGPELRQHGCDDLLFPSAPEAPTVLFKEDALLPSTAWEEVLLLPMPLPPASSVF